ncbi:MAG: surface lipoprotein assembly modifier [Pseudomonadota bacterium]
MGAAKTGGLAGFVPKVALFVVLSALSAAAAAVVAQEGDAIETAPMPDGPAQPTPTQAADQAGSQSLSLEEARVIARSALYAGRYDVARTMAMGLLQADPEDHFAYAVLAAAHSRLDDPKLARAAARLSYKYSDTPGEKFAAARTAASVAVHQKRMTQGQAWLRLAAIHAETDTQEQQIRSDYARARAANPLNFNLSLSVAPSDNVNNGTDNTLLVINGIPAFARFSDATQTLSGVVSTADLRLRYRLHQTQASVTHATARAYTRQVSLSDTVPGVDGGDFSSSFAEIGLSHRFALGAEGNTASVGGSVGSLWSGGDKSFDFVKLEVGRSVKLGDINRLKVTATVEDRASDIEPIRDASVLTLSGTLAHKRPDGGRFTFGLTFQEVSSDQINAEFQTATARVAYTFAEPLGPARITTGVTLGATDYADYTLIGPVEGGREDTSIYADVSFFFEDLSLAGFAPTVTLRSGQRTSNINRFDISETTVSVGLQSKF